MNTYGPKHNIDFKKLLEGGNELLEVLPPVKKRRKKRKLYKIIKYISFLVVFACVFFIGIVVYHIFDIKLAIQEINNGKSNLETALTLFRSGEYEDAKIYSNAAVKSFSTATARSEKICDNIVLQKIYYVNKEVNNLFFISSSAKTLSQAVDEANEFAGEISPLLLGKQNFTALSESEKIEFLKFIYQSTPELNGLKANVELALINFNQIHTNGLLRPFKSKVEKFRSELEYTVSFLNQAIPLSEVVPALLGYPNDQSFLVLIQNQTELRPTGGFIGTYGIVQTKNGEMLRYDTHDVYHLDMPVKDKISVAPPEPLQKYLGVDKWYFRDSNWSPHWPEAAQKAEWFFYEEDKLLPPRDRVNKITGQFDGIIAITPDLITDLLEITGPIEIEGEVYDSENFLELLEYRVEKGYVQLGVPSWHRKEVIGDIAKEMKERIFDLKPVHMAASIEVIVKALRQKNILIYLHDQERQRIISGQNWAGEILKTNNDYLYIVDANMAAYKTDAVMDRRVDYKISEGVNGIFSDLKVSYKHNGEFDWKTTRYRTYTRIYVPLGSELLEVEGFSDLQDDKDSLVSVYEEHGHTVFAGFIVVEPGEIASIRLRYKLPKIVELNAKSGKYQLYLQKQPGKRVDDVELDLYFENNIKSYSPKGFYVSPMSNKIKWETDLLSDREFTVYFK